MVSNFRKIHLWLAASPKHTKGCRILQVIIGSLICFRISTELPFASYLWGPNGINTFENSKSSLGVFLGVFFDTLFFSSMTGVYALLFFLFLGAISLILNIKTRAATIICFLMFILLENRLPAITDGGDNIMRITLIYMILLKPSSSSPGVSPLAIWLHNIGVISIIFQLMIVYETSGFMKACGEKWQNGTAMYVISNVEWFSSPLLNKIFSDPFLCTLVTYGSMFFMIFFPIAIFSRFKLLWIIIGISLHIGIAYSMGLIVFSSVMMALELFLITDKEYESIVHYIKTRLSSFNNELKNSTIYRSIKMKITNE